MVLSLINALHTGYFITPSILVTLFTNVIRTFLNLLPNQTGATYWVKDLEATHSCLRWLVLYDQEDI
jgi:hypothetical protein